MENLHSPSQHKDGNFSSSFNQPTVVNYGYTEINKSLYNDRCTYSRQSDSEQPSIKMMSASSTNKTIFENTNYLSVNGNEPNFTAEEDRSNVVVRRNSSFESREREKFQMNSQKCESDYECMSMPGRFSFSSRRESPTDSHNDKISHDTLPLGSFAGRLNIGRLGLCSKRSSQSSSISSQDSGRHSWGKLRESVDLSDITSCPSLRQPLYENTRSFSPEHLMTGHSKLDVPGNHMEVIADGDNDIPPPLPSRRSERLKPKVTVQQPEMIVPYKVVDLDELHRSLKDIEPHYMHDASEQIAFNPDVREESDEIIDFIEDDIRPALPPKKRPLHHSRSDSYFTVSKDYEVVKPIPLPRKSSKLNDFGQIQNENEQNDSKVELDVSCHFPRRKSSPLNGVSTKPRSESISSLIQRPPRSAPPLPWTQSPNEKVSVRPVSYSFSTSPGTDLSPSIPLKRSMTVTGVQSSLARLQMSSSIQENANSDEDIQEIDGKGKQDRTSKTGAFFKKAFSNLKRPVTWKTSKKDLNLSNNLQPENFSSNITSEYQTFVRNHRNEDLTTISEPLINDVDRVDKMMEDDYDEVLEQKSFHPEFDEFTINNVDDTLYYNVPVEEIDRERKILIPKKPPRSGYLQPSMSQSTIEREQEISESITPKLGPLPIPPEDTKTTDGYEEIPTYILTDHHMTVPCDKHVLDVPEVDCESESSKKLKPDVPQKPMLKPKPKIPARSLKTYEKPTATPRNTVTDFSTIPRSRKVPTAAEKPRRFSTPAENTTSCNLVDDSFTDIHLTVLKDILQCWKKKLLEPTINLIGACWEDFEIVDDDAVFSVEEGILSLRVKLRQEVKHLECDKSKELYLAKIKCKSASTPSPFDYDYSVSTSIQYHENISRVLAYFRGEIPASFLGTNDDDTSLIHTTIALSDQSPIQTCAEFVNQLKTVDCEFVGDYERKVCLLILQCLKGIEHLHSMGYSHNDLSLSNLLLIQHDGDFQLLINNFGKAVGNERQKSSVPNDDSFIETNYGKDLVALSELILLMLHQDHNGNSTDSLKHTTLSLHLRKASETLRDGCGDVKEMIAFLQTLLWGPTKLREDIETMNESNVKQWLDRERAKFVAKLALNEARARVIQDKSRLFSMEDYLYCEYLITVTPISVVRTEKTWFLST